jgi:hypothetical protein
MKRPNATDDLENDARRRFLAMALGTGLLVGGLGWRSEALAQIFGRRPQQLPEGQSIFELRGEVLVNGQRATRDTLIAAGDVVETGRGAYVIGVLGQEAFHIRERSRVELGVAGAARQFFRVVTGAMLAVFGERREQYHVHTVVATIGIRGTGLYTESEPDRSYVCTCYGRTRIAVADQPEIAEDIVSLHHDAPRYVLAQPHNGQRIIPAPFINHTDQELMVLEALVGREVPFAITEDPYERPRRRY